MFVRRGIESLLDELSLRRRRGAVEDFDAVLCELGTGYCGTEDVDQIAFGVLIFGKDEKAFVLPFGIGDPGLFARETDT